MVLKSHLRIFGSKAYPLIPEKLRGKIDEKAYKNCIMIGYCSNQKGYRIWDKINKKAFSSCHVQFDKDSFLTSSKKFISLELYDDDDDEDDDDASKKSVSINQEESKSVLQEKDNKNKSENLQFQVENQTLDNVPNKNKKIPSDQKELCANEENFSPESVPMELDESLKLLSVQNVIRKSERIRKFPAHLIKDYVLSTVHKFTHRVPEKLEPQTYLQAITSSDSEYWKEAMNEEINSIVENNTWELCDPPLNKNIVGSKWVYKLKKEADGSTRYKARLVAQGYSQVKGLDYHEIFSPVARFVSIRILFAIAAKKNFFTRHLDVQTAFLHGNLKEEVYLKQPDGFITKGNEKKVCKLNKAIYDLKQGSKTWSEKLDVILKSLNFKQSQHDLCIYQFSKDASIIYIAVFVNDIFVFSNSETFIQELIKELSKVFPIKDLGKITRCLGVNVTQNIENGTIELDQSDYIIEALKKFNLENCIPCKIPMDPGMILEPDFSPVSNEELKHLSKIPYQNAVGTLMYLLQATRPDISYSVSLVSRFNTNYRETHWKAVKKIFRYLKHTVYYKLTFSREENLSLKGYCDASYISNLQDFKSTSGYIFILQNAAVSWRSKKQAVTATASTVAEYQSLLSATQEALWLRGLCQELNIQDSSPTIIYCDNKSTINFCTNAKFSHATKHLGVKHFFIKENIEAKNIAVDYLPSTEMVADALTKPTSEKVILNLVKNSGLL